MPLTPIVRSTAGRAVPLWVALVVTAACFGVGVFVGAQSALPMSTLVIKGGNPTTATSTVGTVQGIDAPLPSYLTKDVNFKLFWETWNLLKNHYYDSGIPETKLFYGALSGMVAALGDPHSIFLTPQDAQEFQQDLQGNFEGIGAEIGLRDEQLIVIAPLPDTPADRAHLQARDAIIAINGTSTRGMTVDYAVGLIRGPRGTSVTLTLSRAAGRPFEVVITREAITIKSVTWEIINNNQTALITIRQFNNDTVPLLEQAIADIQSRRSVRSVVLDLRNNPGGYLDAAIDVASYWAGDRVIVSERLRDGSTTTHQGTKRSALAGYPTVVLVNGGSASASEIVAGALKDYDEAELIGSTTFGKGSVQDLTELPDGSSVKLTIAKWFTPDNHSIDGVGIEPDVAIEMTEEDYATDRDPQLDRALQILK